MRTGQGVGWVLVTGAASGIGRATALAFAEAGAASFWSTLMIGRCSKHAPRSERRGGIALRGSLALQMPRR